MDRRRRGVVAVVLALLVAASGCSLREVQLWFAVNRKQDISRDQARALADVLNTKKVPGGCDGNYAGGCVPDNATTVHCAGTDGEGGPAVRGPLTIVGWNSFEIQDLDGDRKVCVEPAGRIETFGQRLNDVVAIGWVFDPETTAPIDVEIRNGTSTVVTADDPRPDVDAVFPGVGADHGFASVAPADPGEARYLCVTARNVGAGFDMTLGCKLVFMLKPLSVSLGGTTVTGLVEGVDRVAGGYHVRGFVVPGGTATFTLVDSLAPVLTIPRPDVDAALSVSGAVGFDFLQPTGGEAPGPWCIKVSNLDGSNNPTDIQSLSCRIADT